MARLGIFSLGDTVIAAAGTYTGTPLTRLDGMTGFSAQMFFDYGSGGTSVTAWLQTSLDQGNSWFDLWCEQFLLADKRVNANIRALDGVPMLDAALPVGTVLNGPLGDRLRVKAISLGTYAGPTILSTRVCIR